MTPIEEFQSRHGERWAAIARGPELTDALVTINASLLNSIVGMTPAEVASPVGNIMLARLQGQLSHERMLLDLATIHPTATDDLPPETYPDPTTEEMETEVQRDAATSGATPFQEWQAEQPLTESPKPKKRRRRKK